MGPGPLRRVAQEVARVQFLAIEAEGVPDIAGARRVYGLPPALADEDVAKVVFHHQLQDRPRMPHLATHLRSVAAISLVLCRDDRMQRRDLSVTEEGERALLQELTGVFSADKGPLVVWDGQRDMFSWLSLRALVNGVSWELPAAVRLEDELGLTANPIARHELARRLGIAAIEIPDDETSWQGILDTGMTGAVERCALNAAATTRLWLLSCLTRSTITLDDHDALADQLARVSPLQETDAV